MDQTWAQFLIPKAWRSAQETHEFAGIDCSRADRRHCHNLSSGPSITDRRGLKPALVKPENLRLAHWLSNKKDWLNIIYKLNLIKLLQRSLFHYSKEKASNDQRAHNPVDLTGVYNRRLGSLDQHDPELWAIQEVGHQSHSLDWWVGWACNWHHRPIPPYNT